MTRLKTAFLALTLLSPATALAQTAAMPPPAAPAATLVMPSETPELKYLSAADLIPQRVLPQPPIRGSEREKLELQMLHAMIAAATPERLAQAHADDKNETPSIFNEALGRDLTKLPATWSLLVTVQDEIEAAIDLSKDTFARLRPYNVDETLPTCGHPDKAKAARSYPSGHATMGYAVAMTYAVLAPEKAQALMSRAADYAASREVCGAHYGSDTEASAALSAAVVTALLKDPRFQAKLQLARTELRAAKVTAQ